MRPSPSFLSSQRLGKNLQSTGSSRNPPHPIISILPVEFATHRHIDLDRFEKPSSAGILSIVSNDDMFDLRADAISKGQLPGARYLAEIIELQSEMISLTGFEFVRLIVRRSQLDLVRVAVLAEDFQVDVGIRSGAELLAGFDLHLIAHFVQMLSGTVGFELGNDVPVSFVDRKPPTTLQCEAKIQLTARLPVADEGHWRISFIVRTNFHLMQVPPCTRA